MVAVVMKAFASTEFRLRDGNRVVLKGAGVINSVPKSLWSRVVAEHPNVADMIKDEFLIVTSSASQEASEAMKNKEASELLGKQKKVQAKVKIAEGASVEIATETQA